MSTPALEIRDLVVSYGDREVVRNLTLDAHAGAITAVLGPNGAGKTTTIECAEGLRQPTSGVISVLGHAAGSPQARSRVGVMLQDGGLPMARTTREVLALAASMHLSPIPPGELIERLDLSAVVRTSVRRLSGGQRQRLALAVALIGRPDLVFLDEPSAGLDPHARLEVWQLVRHLRAEGSAVILTTHLIEEADALADQVHVLVDGRVVASGSPTFLVATHAGSDSQRVTFARELTVDELSDLRAALSVQLSVDGAVVTLRGAATPALTLALATWSATHDVLVRSLQVGGGTLEHAYLAITGGAR